MLCIAPSCGVRTSHTPTLVVLSRMPRAVTQPLYAHTGVPSARPVRNVVLMSHPLGVMRSQSTGTV
eukprot:5265086-Alexandrium_andersonii.AAC.1